MSLYIYYYVILDYIYMFSGSYLASYKNTKVYVGIMPFLDHCEKIERTKIPCEEPIVSLMSRGLPKRGRN